MHIDAVNAQALEAAFECLRQMLRASVVRPLPGTGTLPPTLGRNDQARWIWIERLGDQLLRGTRSIGVSGINQVHTQFHRAAHCRERGLLICRRTPHALACDAHRAISKTIHFKVAANCERACGCGSNSLSCAHRITPKIES